MGSQLATMLSADDNNICVVDRNPDAFANLGRTFNGSTVQGIGFDEDTLLRAGVEQCDCLAAVTQQDSTNFMVAEVAKRLYHVPHVITRLFNPEHEHAYEQLGIDYVCGTTLAAEEVYSKIAAGHGAHVDSFGDFELLRFSLNLEDNELEQLKVSSLERQHDIRIVAFERADGHTSSIPTSESVLMHGDMVLACVRHSLTPSFSKWIRS